MYYVYILLCSDKQLYIGYSTDIHKRLGRHRSGYVISTKHRLPFQIVCVECFKNITDAKAREVYLKSGGGHRQLKRQHQHRLRELGYRHL